KFEIAIGLKANLDLCLAAMSSINSTQKLRAIGNAPAPSLSAAKLLSSRRSPQHGTAPVLEGAHEIPLMTAKPSPPWGEDNRLLHVSHSDMQRPFMVPPHV